MPPAGFEAAIPAGDRPQTLALDRSATGIGERINTGIKSFWKVMKFRYLKMTVTQQQKFYGT
jgi:hypothetical protein